MARLTKKQQAYIQTAIANPNLTDKAIGEIIDVTSAMMSRWKTNPDFVAAYDAALKEQWKGAVAKAQAKMLELVDSSKDDIAYKAASYVMDSNGYKATEKIDVNAEVNTIKVEVLDD